jgi:hypothetical protein
VLSKEFGWTPEQINNLTYAQAMHYLEEVNNYRDSIPDAEIALFGIMQMLGYKPPTKKKSGEKKDKPQRLPAVKFTAEQMRRYERDGYPPLKEWLKKERTRGH